MAVFKRSIFTLVKDIGLAILAWPLAYILANTFTQNTSILLSIPSAVTLFFLFLALISGNIRLEIDGDILRYFQMGKLKQEIAISNYRVSFKFIQKKSSYARFDIFFEIASKTQPSFSIDLLPLGKAQFLSFYKTIKEKTQNTSASHAE